MLGNLAASYLHAGQPEAALDCMRQSLVIMRETGKATYAAVCLVNIGVVLTELGRAEAIEPLTEAISLFRSTGDRTSEAFAHCGIAAVHSQHGTLSDALRHYQEGLDRFREVGDLGSAGETLVDISQLQLRHGQLGAAIRDATEGAEISLRTGSRRNLGRALTVLGSALAGRGRPDDARSHWLEAVAIFTDLGSPQAAEVAASLEALDRTPEADPAGR
jgi:tetratricopeptide (TPR) repeat protein